MIQTYLYIGQSYNSYMITNKTPHIYLPIIRLILFIFTVNEGLLCPISGYYRRKLSPPPNVIDKNYTMNTSLNALLRHPNKL